MVEMVKRDILPCVIKYSAELCSDLKIKNETIGCAEVERELATKLNKIESRIYENMTALSKNRHPIKHIDDSYERAKACLGTLIPIMTTLRTACDEAELIVDRKQWPYPVYEDLLYRV